MAYIHSCRVIIGDFRLDNVVYDDQMRIKLLDFSECTLMPLEWDFVGSDDAGFSILTDIAHFGAVMFQIISGKDCAFDIYQEWTQVGDPTVWPSRETLPRTGGIWLGDIIDKCWSKGFMSASELAQALGKET
ncbi:hypothetical protein AYO20_09070 [Fonsecaea nubica]|uniref:Protein kinase domain-containing protein n=1 Tax=Fonsecaea nubica TaxID=856822 RepID=A0A178CII7_9EURO|nr:hypothetical protein AYO20_09070 [Fonsecaea nubica]OAL29778.1 hypothetical protein AYO20_09070 [Fonsecaea nubica]